MSWNQEQDPIIRYRILHMIREKILISGKESKDQIPAYKVPGSLFTDSWIRVMNKAKIKICMPLGFRAR
jgi:hypothetical protein